MGSVPRTESGGRLLAGHHLSHVGDLSPVGMVYSPVRKGAVPAFVALPAPIRFVHGHCRRVLDDGRQAIRVDRRSLHSVAFTVVSMAISRVIEGLKRAI